MPAPSNPTGDTTTCPACGQSVPIDDAHWNRWCRCDETETTVAASVSDPSPGWPGAPDGLRSNETYTADQVWAIIEDLLDSVKLADTTGNDETWGTVEDYAVNQYGIDA